MHGPSEDRDKFGYDYDTMQSYGGGDSDYPGKVGEQPEYTT